MEGYVGFTSIPNAWDSILWNNPNCQANNYAGATVDILDTAGPSLSGGVAGNPYSGNTFCSGLHATDGATMIWHEGIFQVVNGFAIGELYTISFYQSVVKQNNCLDESGSWRVYIDNNLVGTSAPSTSTLAPTDLNLLWENRTMDFTATAATHTISFIPWDDDPSQLTSYSNTSGGLRMGIDEISFVPYPPDVDLGNDTLLCTGQNLLLDASYPGAGYLWQDGSTDSVYLVSQPGTYWVTVSNTYGSVSDTIVVSYESVAVPYIGQDTTLCLGDSLVLSSAITTTTMFWQDGSTANEFTVNSPGVYWLQLDNYCGAGIDSILINYVDCTLLLEMPNIFTPNGDGNNDYFVPVVWQGADSGILSILNRWGNEVYFGKVPSEGWNGNFRDVPCAEGTYYWILQFSSTQGDGEMHGVVHLIR